MFSGLVVVSKSMRDFVPDTSETMGMLGLATSTAIILYASITVRDVTVAAFSGTKDVGKRCSGQLHAAR